MTRRLRRLPLLTALLVILCCSLAYAGGWQYSAIGARAKAMGGAYRAVADDWSGIYYNPAGLAFMQTNVWNVSVETLSPRPEIQTNFTANGFSLGYLDGQTRYPNDKVMMWGTTAICKKPTEGFPLALGGAVYQPFDHNADMNLFYLRPDYNRFDVIPERNHNSNLDVVAFHPAVAMKFSEDRIAIGIGVPVYRGDVFIDQIRLVDNPYDYALDVRPFETFPKLFSVDGYGYGIGFNLGVMFKASENLSLGASYTSSANIKVDGASREEVFLPYNQGIINYYNDPQALTDSSQLEVRAAYSGGSFSAESQFELDLKIPSEFGFGLAYQASEKWLLVADFAYTMWSEFDDFDIVITGREIDRSVYPTWRTMFSDFYVPFQWEDKFRISLGAEGLLTEKWTLRAGYMMDPSPIPDETFSQMFLDTGDKHHLTAGATFWLSESISFDGALEAVLFGERDVTEIMDVNSDGYYDNYGGTFKNKTFSSSWAINYQF